MCQYCNVGSRLREAQNHPATCDVNSLLVDIVKTQQFIFEFTAKDGYHYVLTGDGSILSFSPKCRNATIYLQAEDKPRKRFKYCPYCGRRL